MNSRTQNGNFQKCDENVRQEGEDLGGGGGGYEGREGGLQQSVMNSQ